MEIEETKLQKYKFEALWNNIAYKEFLLSLLDQLATYPPDKGGEKIYVGGRQFIQGMSGVVASSEKVGNVLIEIVGMIIDDNYDYILSMYIDDEERKDEFTVVDMIEYLSEDWEGCNSVHPLKGKSKVELQGNEYTIINPGKMNLWDLKRIRDFISKEEDFGLIVTFEYCYYCAEHDHVHLTDEDSQDLTIGNCKFEKIGYRKSCNGYVTLEDTTPDSEWLDKRKNVTAFYSR